MRISVARSKAFQTNNSSVSVVVLAFNEARSLPTAVQSIHKAIKDKFSEYEIIIVNDGSRDDTNNVAETLAKAKA